MTSDVPETNQNSVICLPSEFPTQLITVIQTLINNLQKRFDMHPSILQNWMQGTEFREWILAEYNKREEQHLGNISNHPKINELREIYHSQQPMEIIIRHLGWAREECGHVIERHDNGYVEYCNVQRFEHSDNTHQRTSDQRASDAHEYQRKTYQQIIEQKIFDCKIMLYESFLNDMLEMLLEHFEKYLTQNYQIHRTQVDKDSINKLMIWIKNHPTVIKSNQGLIALDQSKQEYLDLYLPKNNRFRIPVETTVLQ